MNEATRTYNKGIKEKRDQQGSQSSTASDDRRFKKKNCCPLGFSPLTTEDAQMLT